MKREKVVFDFVASKPIESTEDPEEASPEPPHGPPTRAFSSMFYKEALKYGILKSPVIK